MQHGAVFGTNAADIIKRLPLSVMGTPDDDLEAFKSKWRKNVVGHSWISEVSIQSNRFSLTCLTTLAWKLHRLCHE